MTRDQITFDIDGESPAIVDDFFPTADGNLIEREYQIDAELMTKLQRHFDMRMKLGTGWEFKTTADEDKMSAVMPLLQSFLSDYGCLLDRGCPDYTPRFLSGGAFTRL